MAQQQDFSFEITKIKELQELLTVIQKTGKICCMVVLPDRICIVKVNEYLEDAQFCILHQNMLDNFLLNRPCLLGINLPEWINILHECKEQHVKCVCIFNNPKTGYFHFTGSNPATKFSLSKKSANIEIDTNVPLIKKSRRIFPLGPVCIPSKKFYQHIRNLSKRHCWIRLELDVLKQRMNLIGTDQYLSTMTPSHCSFDVRIVRTPFMHDLPDYLSTPLAILIQSFFTPNLPTTISVICAIDKLLMYAHAYKVNAFVMLWMAPDTELLMEYIIRASPVSSTLNSRLECWVGRQVLKKNEALLQSTPTTVAFEESKSPLSLKKKTKKRPKKINEMNNNKKIKHLLE